MGRLKALDATQEAWNEVDELRAQARLYTFLLGKRVYRLRSEGTRSASLVPLLMWTSSGHWHASLHVKDLGFNSL